MATGFSTRSGPDGYRLNFDTDNLDYYLLMQKIARHCVDGKPAADVAPVRHGRWDENGRCTLCGGHAPFWAMASTYYKSPWCHECGARMDKEVET